MRYHFLLGVFAPVFVLTTLGLLAPCHAQGIAGAVDFRERSRYSAEDLARALFAPQETSSIEPRGMGLLPGSSSPDSRPAVILNVLFESNSDAIMSASEEDLKKLGTVLGWPQYADYRIQLAGYTDNRGSKRKNQVLSEKRAQKIKDYLIRNFNVAPERVHTIGYGMSGYIASNDTPEGRSKNRRVEATNLGREQ